MSDDLQANYDITIEGRDAVMKAWEASGGQKAFNAWVEENRKDFYLKIFLKVVPSSPINSKDGAKEETEFEKALRLGASGEELGASESE